MGRRIVCSRHLQAAMDWRGIEPRVSALRTRRLTIRLPAQGLFTKALRKGAILTNGTAFLQRVCDLVSPWETRPRRQSLRGNALCIAQGWLGLSASHLGSRCPDCKITETKGIY